MTMRRWGVWLPAVLGLMACSNGGGAGSTSSDGGTTTGPRSGPLGTPGTSNGPGANSASQLAVLLQNTGRHGDTLLITLKGSDPASQTTEAHVRLLDAAGNPVNAFDTDWDNLPDAAEKRVHFDQSTLGQTSFTATITLPGLYAANKTIASAEVALSDVNGTLSPAVNATLLPQVVDALGASCDVNSVADRCEEGLGCGGKPATCQAGTAPTLTTVGYFGGTSPMQLFVGNDPDADLASITVNFLDASGKATTIDLSGDNDMASSVVLDARSATGGSTFFFESDPTARFIGLVPKISATPTDSFGRSGQPVVATVANQPVRQNGQTCDMQGFTACAAGYACSPGIAGATNVCGGVSRLQSDKCKAAPTPSTGVLSGWGIAQGVSLWDPPAGCAVPTDVNRPESIVAFKLDHTVNLLTLSTANPETDFDTILYVLPGCAATAADALGCNDNGPQGYASTLTLSNVPAGVYVAVIDSTDWRGGHFGLSITMQ